jgi:hypothetical protein
MTLEVQFTNVAKIQFHTKIVSLVYNLRSICYASICIVHFGWHAKNCSVTCNYLKNMHTAKAPCCTAPMLPVANAACCVLNNQN